MSHAKTPETNSSDRHAQRIADEKLRETARECGIEQAYLFARLINKADKHLAAHPIFNKNSLSIQEAYRQAHITRPFVDLWKGIRTDTMTALQGGLINPSDGKLYEQILTALKTTAQKNPEMAYRVLDLVRYLETTTQAPAWNTAKEIISPIIDAHRANVTGRRTMHPTLPPLTSPPLTASTPSISPASLDDDQSTSSSSLSTQATGKPPLPPLRRGARAEPPRTTHSDDSLVQPFFRRHGSSLSSVLASARAEAATSTRG